MAESNPAPRDEFILTTAWMISNPEAAQEKLKKALEFVEAKSLAVSGTQTTPESHVSRALSQATGSGPAYFPRFPRLPPEIRLITWQAASFNWFNTFIPMIDMGPPELVSATGEFDAIIEQCAIERDLLVKDLRACLRLSPLSRVSVEARKAYEESREEENRYMYNIEHEVGFNDYLQLVPLYFQRLVQKTGPPVAISMTMTQNNPRTRRNLIRTMLDCDNRIDTLFLMNTPEEINEDQHSWAETMGAGPGQYYCMKMDRITKGDFGINIPVFDEPEEAKTFDAHLCNKIIYHNDHEGKCSMWVEVAHLTTLESEEVVIKFAGRARSPFGNQDAALTELRGHFIREPRLKHVGILYPFDKFMGSK